MRRSDRSGQQDDGESSYGAAQASHSSANPEDFFILFRLNIRGCSGTGQ
jgi:hypothetical protein